MPRVINAASSSMMTLPGGSTPTTTTATPLRPILIKGEPLKITKKCVKCENFGRVYGDECAYCYNAVCDPCGRRTIGLMSLQACCGNKWCGKCPHEEMAKDCGHCRRKGCSVCVDNNCLICHELICDSCYRPCGTCREHICLKHLVMPTEATPLCINCANKKPKKKRSHDESEDGASEEDIEDIDDDDDDDEEEEEGEVSRSPEVVLLE